MKSAGVAQLRKELRERSPEELVAICLRMARSKAENKELLTYLLFEAEDESRYIENVKADVGRQLQEVNRKNYYWMRKGVRKVLREVKKYAKFSQKKETEVELLVDFCIRLKSLSPPIHRDKSLQNLFDRQVLLIEKKIEGLHEDLQFDFNYQLKEALGQTT